MVVRIVAWIFVKNKAKNTHNCKTEMALNLFGLHFRLFALSRSNICEYNICRVFCIFFASNLLSDGRGRAARALLLWLVAQQMKHMQVFLGNGCASAGRKETCNYFWHAVTVMFPICRALIGTMLNFSSRNRLRRSQPKSGSNKKRTLNRYHKGNVFHTTRSFHSDNWPEQPKWPSKL